LFGVLPGEAVPILSKGLVTITADAFSSAGAPGQVIQTAADGKVEPVARGSATNQVVGTILATGTRDDEAGSQGGTNVFGNTGLMNGAYYLVKLDCA